MFTPGRFGLQPEKFTFFYQLGRVVSTGFIDFDLCRWCQDGNSPGQIRSVIHGRPAIAAAADSGYGSVEYKANLSALLEKKDPPFRPKKN